MIDGFFFNFSKLDYVKKKTDDSRCIICSLVSKNASLPDLELFRSELSAVSFNLYPYNTGHLMIYPLRHVEDICCLSDAEAADIHRLTVRSIELLRSEMSPSGFNLGYNIGDASGASIKHIHFHIVPRYANEIGFAEILSGKKVCVSDPFKLKEKLRGRF